MLSVDDVGAIVVVVVVVGVGRVVRVPAAGAGAARRIVVAELLGRLVREGGEWGGGDVLGALLDLVEVVGLQDLELVRELVREVAAGGAGVDVLIAAAVVRDAHAHADGDADGGERDHARLDHPGVAQVVEVQGHHWFVACLVLLPFLVLKPDRLGSLGSPRLLSTR